MLGTVDAFDERRGDGDVLGDDGRHYYLHCIEIADGSRSIEVGRRVIFSRRPGLTGHDEAVEVQPVLDADSRT